MPCTGTPSDKAIPRKISKARLCSAKVTTAAGELVARIAFTLAIAPEEDA